MHFSTRQRSILFGAMAVVLLVLPMMRSDEDTNSSGAAIVTVTAERTSLMPTHQQ
jgi:hypothetical protein